MNYYIPQWEERTSYGFRRIDPYGKLFEERIIFLGTPISDDIAIQAEQMLYTKRMFQERVSFHTGQDQAQIEADSDRDRWFTAEQAQDYGMVDQVVSNAGQVAGSGGTA